MKMEHKQAAKLIIENIQLLEQANNLILGELGKYFFGAVDQVIKVNAIEIDETIIGLYDLYNNQIWFISEKWKKEMFDFENKKTWNDMYAWYELDTENDENGLSNFYISHFFNNELNRIVFRFSLSRNSFNKISAKYWKAFISQMNQTYPQIEKLGFKFNDEADGNWYIPIVSLDQKSVAENYVNEILEDALTPITDALDILKQAHPYFDKIVQTAIAKFGRIEEDEAI